MQRIQFGHAGGRRVYDRSHHPFGRMCRALGVEHRHTKAYHPRTNGRAARMVRTVRDTTVKAYQYDTRDALTAHVQAFVTAYNFGRHLKRLRWRTPFQSVCDHWGADPAPF